MFPYGLSVLLKLPFVASDCLSFFRIIRRLCWGECLGFNSPFYILHPLPFRLGFIPSSSSPLSEWKAKALFPTSKQPRVHFGALFPCALSWRCLLRYSYTEPHECCCVHFSRSLFVLFLPQPHTKPSSHMAFSFQSNVLQVQPNGGYRVSHRLHGYAVCSLKEGIVCHANVSPALHLATLCFTTCTHMRMRINGCTRWLMRSIMSTRMKWTCSPQREFLSLWKCL